MHVASLFGESPIAKQMFKADIDIPVLISGITA